MRVGALQNNLVAQANKKFFGRFLPVAVTEAGLSTSQSLIFEVRDDLDRPERMNTEPGDPPCLVQTTAYPAKEEKRLLITQPNLGSVLAKKTAGAIGLRNRLGEAFHGKDLRQFNDLRSGGFMSSTHPHISVITTCGVGQLRDLPPGFLGLCLVTSEDGWYPTVMFGDLKPHNDEELKLCKASLLKRSRTNPAKCLLRPAYKTALSM